MTPANPPIPSAAAALVRELERVHALHATRASNPILAGALERLGDVLCVAEPGFVETYMAGGRPAPARPVVLRQTLPGAESIYGRTGDWIRSESALRLDLGDGRLPGMLALGAEDPHQFRPNQGTDLVTFFGGVFERAMRRWLA